MPTEPNQNADEMLKSYARKRRQQTTEQGCRMSQVTRNMLHAEVARQAHNPSGASGDRKVFKGSLVTQWIWAAAGVALVCIGLGLWFHFEHRDELALAQNTTTLFREDSGEALPTSHAPEPGVLNERVQGFENRPLRETLARRAGGATSQEKLAESEQLAQNTLSAPPREEKRIEVAMAPTVNKAFDTEMLSNSPKFSYGLSGSSDQKDLDRAKDTANELADKTAKSASVALKEDGVELLKQQADSAPSSIPALKSSTPSPEARGRAKSELTDSLAASPPKAASALSVAPAQTPAPADASQSLTTAKTVQLARNQAKQTDLAAAVPVSQALFFKQVDADSHYRRNFNSPPPPNVLRNFQVQQIGQKLRIVDGDGSVYEGPIAQSSNLAAVTQATASLNQAERGLGRSSQVRDEQITRQVDQNVAGPAAVAAQTQAGVQADTAALGANGAANMFGFRVAGTNRTLNQLVIFTGNIDESVAQPVNSIAGGLGGGGGYDRYGRPGLQSQPATVQTVGASQVTLRGVVPNSTQNAPNQRNNLLPGRIQGSASFGRNQITIEAQQVEP